MSSSWWSFLPNLWALDFDFFLSLCHLLWLIFLSSFSWGWGSSIPLPETSWPQICGDVRQLFAKLMLSARGSAGETALYQVHAAIFINTQPAQVLVLCFHCLLSLSAVLSTSTLRLSTLSWRHDSSSFNMPRPDLSVKSSTACDTLWFFPTARSLVCWFSHHLTLLR